MRTLYKALCELVDKDEVDIWLNSPCERFDGATPNEVINRGDIDLIWDVVEYLESGRAG